MHEKYCCVNESPRFFHKGHSIKTFDRNVSIISKFENPFIALLDNMFSKDECDELINISENKLKRSTTVDNTTGGEKIIAERTSFGTYFQINENDLITKFDQRISEVTNSPIENGEGLQILKYSVGAEYKPHFDYFDENVNNGSHLVRGGQRIATLIVYLNDVEHGGETIFPSIGLSVVPRIGSAVYFEYCNSLGQVNPLSLHGGAPVLSGEKWIATKWMRQGKFQ